MTTTNDDNHLGSLLADYWQDASLRNPDIDEPTVVMVSDGPFWTRAGIGPRDEQTEGWDRFLRYSPGPCTSGHVSLQEAAELLASI